jgi:hypothetical protein
MNRKEKIKYLQLISEGKAAPNIFRQGQIYLVEHNSKSETYSVSLFGESHSKKVMNKEQFEQFRERVEQQSRLASPGENSVLFWYEEKTYE